MPAASAAAMIRSCKRARRSTMARVLFLVSMVSLALMSQPAVAQEGPTNCKRCVLDECFPVDPPCNIYCAEGWCESCEEGWDCINGLCETRPTYQGGQYCGLSCYQSGQQCGGSDDLLLDGTVAPANPAAVASMGPADSPPFLRLVASRADGVILRTRRSCDGVVVTRRIPPQRRNAIAQALRTLQL